MFKDYYQVLEITQQASLNEIKQAYRAASKKWHPDVNPGKDTTQIMQDINEAYAILKDETKRMRYDAEYVLFHQKKTEHKQTVETQYAENDWSYDYEVKDENLKEDIKSARQYAKELVDEFLSSLKDDSRKAVKGAWEGAKGYVFAAIILFAIGLIVALINQ